MKKLDGYKTRAEIAEELNVSQKTLYRKLKELNIDLPYKRFLSPVEYKVIYKELKVLSKE